MLRIKTALPVLLSGAVLSAGAFAAPSVYPTGVTRYDPNKAFNQYVIFSGADKQTHLIDMNGNEVKTWPQAGFPSAIIDPTARLEDGVIVDPLVVIGPRVEIGSGTIIGAGAVIGADVKIGRDCNVGAKTTIQFALIGNNVLIHPGCNIGQDVYGFIFFGPKGHVKVPQTGRVVIQNNVEVGAASTIDRGSLRDTVIGEGTKIDNQVQIGHNVTIGRHCLLAAQIGLAVSRQAAGGFASLALLKTANNCSEVFNSSRANQSAGKRKSGCTETVLATLTLFAEWCITLEAHDLCGSEHRCRRSDQFLR